MRMYHMTMTKNLPSILEKGLIPQAENGLTCDNRMWNHVFLTTDIEKVICEHLGIHNYIEEDWTILVIDCQGLFIYSHTHKHWYDGKIIHSKFEFVTKSVPVQNIIGIFIPSATSLINQNDQRLTHETNILSSNVHSDEHLGLALRSN